MKPDAHQELLDCQLYSALSNNDAEMAVQALEAGADPNREFAGETALHIAVERRQKDLVISLLAHGASPAAKTRFYEQTALHIAADLGDFEIARRLIEGGADKEARTNGGWTPLLVAASKGHFSVAALLVERGANVNARNNAGETGLHFVENIDARYFSWLVGHVKAIDETDENRATPLTYAAAYGRTDLAAILLDNGASPAHRDYEGKTPAEIARQRGFSQTAEFIARFE